MAYARAGIPALLLLAACPRTAPQLQFDAGSAAETGEAGVVVAFPATAPGLPKQPCDVAPVLFFDGRTEGGISALLAADDGLYVALHAPGANAVQRVIAAGAAPELLMFGIGITLELAVSTSDLVALVSTPDSMITFRCPRAGGQLSRLASWPAQNTKAASMVVRNSFVYWVLQDVSTGFVIGRALDSDSVSSVDIGSWAAPSHLVAFEQALAWLSGDRVLILAPNARVQVASGALSPAGGGWTSLVADPVRKRLLVSDHDRIVSIDDGGTATTLVESGGGIGHLVIDPLHDELVWAEDESASLCLLPLGGGSPRCFAFGPGTVESLAIGGGQMFWSWTGSTYVFSRGTDACR